MLHVLVFLPNDERLISSRRLEDPYDNPYTEMTTKVSEFNKAATKEWMFR
jgi:hypothetical protein